MKDLYIVTEALSLEHKKKLDTLIFDVVGIKPGEVIFTDIDSMQLSSDSIVVTMGADALKALAGKGSITKEQGVWKRIKNIELLPTFSIGYTMRNPEHLQTIANDLFKAHSKSLGLVLEETRTRILKCRTMASVDEVLGYIQEVGDVAFDFETSPIDDDLGTFYEGFKITCISLCFQQGCAYVIPLEHQENVWFTPDEIEIIWAKLNKFIFSDYNIRKVCHNVNYEMHCIAKRGYRMRGRLDDPMLKHHLLDETKSHRLKDIVAEYLPEFTGYENEMNTSVSWELRDIEELMTYCGIDSDVTMRIDTLFESKLLEDGRLYRIYRNLTMAAVRPLFEAEYDGALIDREFLVNAIKISEGYIEDQEKKLRSFTEVAQFEQAINEFETDKEIQRLNERLLKWRETHKNSSKTETNLVTKIASIKAGLVSVYEKINFGSTKQLPELLYTNAYGFKFKSWDRTTARSVLIELDDKSGFIDELLLFRSMQKLLSTYLIGLLKRLDRNDRVHTSFKLHGTVSGRLSSSNPNLQNLPNISKLKDTKIIEMVSMVKKAFIALPEHKILQVDFSQAELRIIAEFANETAMLQAYADGKDLHSVTAAKVMRVAFEKWLVLTDAEKKESRTRAKAVNFGLIYGMGAKGFKAYAKENYGIEITLEESELVRRNFFNGYPMIEEYHGIYVAKAREFGHVRTLFGRKRRTPDILSDDDFKASMDERVAVNSPIQGTAGELTIFAIALNYHRLPKSVKLFCTVHDSILYYLPPYESLDGTAKIIRNTCENAPLKKYFLRELTKVTMKVDIEQSETNWKELKEF